MRYASNCRGCGLTPCNCYLGATYGGCGCGCGGGCSCGRQTVLQQSVPSCGSKSSGCNFCREPQVYLTSNLIVLDANTDMQIKVSDSTKLYLGQGIQIGEYYFQVTEIVDSKTVKIAHNGTATPGANLNAINSAYGCYQYPIYYVGIVDLSYEPPYLEGVDLSFDEVSDSIVDPTLTYTYGYLGPDKIQFDINLQCEIDNTPHYVEISLPEGANSPLAAFSAVLIISNVSYPLVAYKRGATLVVGPGNSNAFTDGVGRTILVSGSYGV